MIGNRPDSIHQWGLSVHVLEVEEGREEAQDVHQLVLLTKPGQVMGDSSPLLINPQYKQVGKSPKREINDSLQHICIYTNELTAPRDGTQ